MPFPTTVRGVQRFVGCLVYYHRFIDNFAAYAAALYELTDSQLKTGDLGHAEKAFVDLKNKLIEAPVLKHADTSLPFAVIIFVNAWAFGVVVCQEHDGVLHPVRFVSRVLTHPTP